MRPQIVIVLGLLLVAIFAAGVVQFALLAGDDDEPLRPVRSSTTTTLTTSTSSTSPTAP
jgi:hypothetical protein